MGIAPEPSEFCGELVWRTPLGQVCFDGPDRIKFETNGHYGNNGDVLIAIACLIEALHRVY